MSNAAVFEGGLRGDRSRGLFLRKFLRHGRRVASLAPSSRSLARVACRGVDPTRAQNIVELGARAHQRSRLPSLPLQTRTAILEAYRGFATLGAWFSQLTVMPLVFWRFYNRLFREVRFDWALWNVPPAGVYHCRGVRSFPRAGQSWRRRS